MGKFNLLFIVSLALCLLMSGTASALDNVALNGTATQSNSPYGAWPASNAIDDDINTGSHTSNGADEWWEVDLGGEYWIQRVEIVNRESCCWERLEIAVLKMLDSSRNEIYVSYPISGTSLGSLHIFDNRDAGFFQVRYIRVERSYEYLTLMELRAFGSEGGMPAWNPDPYDGETRVALDASLAWNATLDPNDPSLPNKDLVSHKVYMSNGDPNDPSLSLVATVPAAYPQLTASWDPGGFQKDEEYWWQIVEVMTGASEIPGDIWNFATIKSVPEIAPDYPEDALVPLGKDATFTVIAANPYQNYASTGMTYQWVKDGMVLSDMDAQYTGVQTDTLTVLVVDAADEGQYFCRVVIVDPPNMETADSRSASLVVGRLVGHWPFEGNLDDIIAGNDGVKNDGDPNFVAGIVGSSAIELDGVEEHIVVPVAAFDEVETLISVSLWVNNGPLKSMTTFAAYDVDGNRMISSHLPWGNRNVYFDAGNPTGYDRINRSIDYTEMEGLWNHFVYTKNCATGEMKIYRNGVLWHSGGGRTRTLYGAILFYIGRGFGTGENHRGLIDDFRIYDYDLSAEDVAQLYYDVTGVAQCLNSPAYDLTGPDGVPDCRVNLYDFASSAGEWLRCGRSSPSVFCP